MPEPRWHNDRESDNSRSETRQLVLGVEDARTVIATCIMDGLRFECEKNEIHEPNRFLYNNSNLLVDFQVKWDNPHGITKVNRTWF